MSGHHPADLLYRFIAHDKWESQHLRGSMRLPRSNVEVRVIEDFIVDLE
jgi:hypothetical protein